MSGGYNYADAYSKYKKGTNSNSDFEKYVDSQGDLKSAWARIKSDPTHPDSDYWIKRGATSKAAFGRAHAAEDSALYSGTYQGGTDYTKGSDAWKDLFKGRTNTRFDEWNKNKGKKKDDTETPTGPIKHDNPYFPMLTQDYSSPASQDWSSYLGGNKGLLFQPWTSDYQAAAGIPNNLWNYAPPEGIDYAVRYTNPLTGKLDMNLMPAGDSKTGDDKTGAKKGSDKAKDLAAGRTHHPEMYDANDMWIGAEGAGGGEAPEGGWGGGAFSAAEILSGIAGSARPGSGNRQAGLSMLGRMGMFGPSFGVNPSLSTSGVAGFTDPEVTGFGGETGGEIDWGGGPDDFM